MKCFFILVLMISSVSANDDLRRFSKAYKVKNMSLACDMGRRLFRSNIRDENVLIAVGDACSEADFIDFVGVLQQRFGRSANSRKAAVYFSSLVLQKRLIAQYMYEDRDLNFYSLPHSEHILSKVYEAIKKEEFTLISQNPKHLHIGDKENYIDLYLKEKIYVDVYENSQKIQEHRYR